MQKNSELTITKVNENNKTESVTISFSSLEERKQFARDNGKDVSKMSYHELLTIIEESEKRRMRKMYYAIAAFCVLIMSASIFVCSFCNARKAPDMFLMILWSVICTLNIIAVGRASKIIFRTLPAIIGIIKSHIK